MSALSYMKIFSEISLLDMNLKNRIIMAPMATGMASWNGKVTDQMISYYESRAKGGAGLVIVEGTAVAKKGVGWANGLCICEDDDVIGMRKLVAAIHRAGSKTALEIFHAGSKASPELTGTQNVAPSQVSSWVNPVIPRELSVSEIIEIEDQFAMAAARAKSAGFDAIEIHAAHGYLIQQFLSPISNHRDDEYGGNTNGRCRFAVEILKKIRKAVGDRFPILVRFSADEGLGNRGINIEESRRILPVLENAGANMIDISVSGAETGYLCEASISFPWGMNRYLATGLKEYIHIPISIVGKIKTPQLAEEILVNDGIDFVTLGRELIADPDFPNKAKDGKEDEIRCCISCNQGCAGRLSAGWPISCTMNPSTGREYLGYKSCGVGKRVIVAGGGVAGMSAAIFLKMRGHNPILVEKSRQLGGKLLAAKVPLNKKELETFYLFLLNEIERLKIEVLYETAFSSELITEYEAEKVIVATGSIPRQLPCDKKKSGDIPTVQAIDVILGNVEVGKKVLIIGGGETALETAEIVANQGREVVIMYRGNTVGKEMSRGERKLYFERCRNLSIEILTNACPVSFRGSTVIYDAGKCTYEKRGIDTVVLAIGFIPQKADASEHALYIGDCNGGNNLYHAVMDAYESVIKIEEEE